MIVARQGGPRGNHPTAPSRSTQRKLLPNIFVPFLFPALAPAVIGRFTVGINTPTLCEVYEGCGSGAISSTRRGFSVASSENRPGMPMNF